MVETVIKEFRRFQVLTIGITRYKKITGKNLKLYLVSLIYSLRLILIMFREHNKQRHEN